MIIAVDDEQVQLDLLITALAPDGYHVKTFTSAIDALAFAEQEPPLLIISDIEMPDMDGFQFHKAYVTKFAHRHTPFVFLSSHSDVATVIKGLDSGADDYLQKPLFPEIIQAKVRSLLNRKKQYIAQTFSGDLAKLPFDRVMHFCELKNLTGWVDISSGEYTAKFLFKGGELLVDDTNDDIEKVFDLQEGTFSICVQPVDYQEIISSAASISPQNSRSGRSTHEKPMGKLSGVQVQQRLFQIQTEFSDLTENQIVSIVILDGKVLLKRKHQIGESTDKAELEVIIESQHLSVEEEVRTKLDKLVEQSHSRVTDSDKSFNQLYDEGFDKYREGNLQKALSLWEEAQKIKPDDKTLSVNLSIVKKKLANQEPINTT
ncbi:MAG: response regulator [Candidatus Marinimicrobia bacterium]|nr:response regulator [Candidatus Neomarinimicrobiota bacterium]